MGCFSAASLKCKIFLFRCIFENDVITCEPVLLSASKLTAIMLLVYMHITAACQLKAELFAYYMPGIVNKFKTVFSNKRAD